MRERGSPRFDIGPAMRYPTRIRLDRYAYEVQTTTFHLSIHAHAKVTAWTVPVGDAIWDTICEQQAAGRVELLAACLMPDHVHLIVQPREQNVLDFLRTWKSWSTRKSWAAGHRGSLWQPGMWDRTVRGYDDFVLARPYVLNNPVAAGLVHVPEDWRWSWAVDVDA